MDFRRKFKRYPTKSSFEVFDCKTGQSVGYLLDISSAGMKLMSKKAVEVEATFKLKVNLPEEITGTNQIIIDAKSVWCKHIDNLDVFFTGFKFHTIFPEQSEILKLLAEMPQFQDSSMNLNEISKL